MSGGDPRGTPVKTALKNTQNCGIWTHITSLCKSEPGPFEKGAQLGKLRKMRKIWENRQKW